MNVKEKKTTTTKSSTKKTATVSEKVGNYEKHPFFIRKTAAAKDFLLKAGLPNQLTKKVQA